MSNLIRKQHISLFKWNGRSHSRSLVPINIQSTIISVYILHRFWSSQYTNNVSSMHTQCACRVIKLIYGMFINLRFSNIYRINLVKVCLIDRLISYSCKRCSKIIELEINNGYSGGGAGGIVGTSRFED